MDKKKRKNLGSAMIVVAVYLTLIILDSAIAYIRYFQFAYYDSSPELVLAHMLSEENALLSKNWFYSTEIRVLHTQIITSILFKFIDNWRIVKCLTTGIHLFLLASSAVWLFRKLGGCKRYFFSGVLMLVPFSWLSISYVLGGLYYIPHFIVIFVAIALFFETRNCIDRRKKIILFALELALAFFAGAGGIRHLEITYMPLLLSCFACMNLHGNIWHDNRDDICHSVSVFFCAGVGYLINSKVLAKIYSFSSYNNLKLKPFSLDRVAQIINGVLGNFGCTWDISIFSIRGIVSVICLIVFILVLLLSIHAKKLMGRFAYEEKILLLCTFFSWIINLGVLLFTDNACEPRYFLPQIIMTIISVNVLFHYCEKPYKTFVGVIFLCFIIGTAACGYKSWLVRDNNSPEMREAAKYLVDEGYHYGYTKFYTGNVIPELTNGSIDIYCVGDYGTLSPNTWLMKKDMLDKRDSTEKTFILMTLKEYDDSKSLPYIQRGKVGFKNKAYVVLEYGDNSEMWEMVTGA